MASAAPAPATGIVSIMRVGEQNFGEVDIYEGDTVARLAERASKKLEWSVPSTWVSLCLVGEGRARVLSSHVGALVEPSDIGRPLSSILKLDDKEAQVVPGSYLLALIGAAVASAPPCPTHHALDIPNAHCFSRPSPLSPLSFLQLALLRLSVLAVRMEGVAVLVAVQLLVALARPTVQACRASSRSAQTTWKPLRACLCFA